MSLQDQNAAAPQGSDAAIEQVAGGDGWWGRWRGVQAWELTVETPIVVAATLWAIMTGNQFVVDALVKLNPLITIYLGARYAVLGVHVYRGSIERSYGLQQVRSGSGSMTAGTTSSRAD